MADLPQEAMSPFWLHRLNILIWTPVLFVLITLGYLLAAPVFAFNALREGYFNHWKG